MDLFDFDLDLGLPPWVLKSAGIAFLVILFLKFVCWVWFMTFAGRKKLKVRKGKWAIVTGASDGIGKEFCFQLAHLGYNICLMSRTKSKLDAVAEVCRTNSKVETKVVPCDFSLPGSEYVDLLQKEISGLECDVLVNNVGISFDYPDFFLSTENDFDERMLNVNVLSMLKMTRAVVPGMVERKFGYVINLASIAGTSPIPLLSTYSASKVYVDYFSQALQVEHKKDGIVVKCATPMFVATEMAKMRPSFSVPTPKRLVQDCLKQMGGDVSFSPYWVHRLTQWGFSCMPDGMRNNYLFNLNSGLKKAALRRKERLRAREAKQQ